MGMSARLKAGSAALSAVLLTSAVSVVVTTGPAAADSSPISAAMTSLAYTDSLAPKQSFENPSGDLPLGAWAGADGATHESRIYVTFDVSAFKGTDITYAQLSFVETQVTQCRSRSVEVWQTRTPTYPVTWHHAPAGKTLLGTVPASATCPGYYSLDLTAAVHSAVAQHRKDFSVALRLPSAAEADVSLGRWIRNSSLGLNMRYNTPPTTPTEPFNDERACTTSAPYTYIGETTPSLEAIFSDPDPFDSVISGDFAVWPIGDPANRTVFSRPVGQGREQSTYVPSGILANGGTYGWQARGDDGTDQSAWSEPCYFTVDSTRPNLPTVASTAFPAGQRAPGGAPGAFTFSANGSADVIGYQYTWGGMSVFGPTRDANGVPQWPDLFSLPGFVRADSLGGSATVTLVPPGEVSVLTVRSISTSYDVSDNTTYSVMVQSTTPTVTAASTPKYGVPFTLDFTPNPAVSGVQSYTYNIGNGPAQTVAANADGTASVSVTMTTEVRGNDTITVRSNSANGWISSPDVFFPGIVTTPTIASDIYAEDNGTGNADGGVGVTGTFTLTSNVPDAVSVTYSVDWGDETTIPLDADGTAQVQWTPDTNGQHVLYAYVTGADGTVFDTYYYYFNVN